MAHWADINDSGLIRFLQQVEKAVGEVERAEVVDGIGHLNP